MDEETLDEFGINSLSNARLGFLVRLSRLDVRRTTHGAIADELGLSIFAVRTALKDLELGGFITIITSPQGVSIAIHNWVIESINQLLSK